MGEEWKLVPVEPTREMIARGSWERHPENVWREMLAAAPASPSQDEENVFRIWWSNAIEHAALLCRQAAQREADAGNSADGRDAPLHFQRANQAKELEDAIRALATGRPYHTQLDQTSPSQELREALEALSDAANALEGARCGFEKAGFYDTAKLIGIAEDRARALLSRTKG